MSEPEIRTHYQLKDLYLPPLPPKMVRHEQRAIPWCTTHEQASIPGNTTMLVCRHAVDVDQVDDCVVSTGGSGHKWWVDI